MVIAQHVHVWFIQHVPLPFAVRGETSPPLAVSGSTFTSTSIASGTARMWMVRKIGYSAIVLEKYKHIMETVGKFLGVRLTTYHLLVPNVKKIRGLNLPDHSWACSGL
jgi:hypothetical protein